MYHILLIRYCSFSLTCFMDASIAELKGKLSLYSQGEVEQAKLGVEEKNEGKK